MSIREYDCMMDCCWGRACVSNGWKTIKLSGNQSGKLVQPYNVTLAAYFRANVWFLF